MGFEAGYSDFFVEKCRGDVLNTKIFYNKEKDIRVR